MAPSSTTASAASTSAPPLRGPRSELGMQRLFRCKLCSSEASTCGSPSSLPARQDQVTLRHSALEERTPSSPKKHPFCACLPYPFSALSRASHSLSNPSTPSTASSPASSRTLLSSSTFPEDVDNQGQHTVSIVSVCHCFGGAWRPRALFCHQRQTSETKH